MAYRPAMDIKLVLSTFLTIFLAELGDKTQITALTLAAGSQRPVSVFIGASAALMTSTLIAVAAAEPLSKLVSVRVTQAVSGALLITMGAYYLFSAYRGAAGG